MYMGINEEEKSNERDIEGGIINGPGTVIGI